MESDYFEKIQKRYDELAKEGYSLVSGKKFYQSLLKELPDVPEDTFCTHEYMFRIHESIHENQSFKTLSYRRYNDETFEWSEWRENDFNGTDDMTRTILDSYPSVYWKDDNDDERIDFMWGVLLKDKRIYLLNMAVGEKSYVPSRQLVFYAPELLQKKYVRKSDKKEIGGDIFPWLFIEVGLPALRYSNTPVNAEIFSLHNRETKEESRHSFAMRLVHGFPEVYRVKEGSNAYKKTIEDVEACLDKGVLPAEIINAPIHIDYDFVMFTPAQGLQYAQERIKALEKKLNEINPEFLRLKEILDMTPEEKEKFLQEEKKKEQEGKKKKAAERAEKKRIEEEESKKKNKLSMISFFVLLASLAIAALPLSLSEEIDFLDDNTFVTYIIAIAIFIGLRYAWRPIKKNLRKKWGMKESE